MMRFHSWKMVGAWDHCIAHVSESTNLQSDDQESKREQRYQAVTMLKPTLLQFRGIAREAHWPEAPTHNLNPKTPM